MADQTTCQGCGTEIQQPKRGGRRRKWCSDICRKKHTYGGACVDCGSPTSYASKGCGTPSERCRECSSASRIVWTSEAIVAKIREWATGHGEPPVATDWQSAGDWPSVNTVQGAFGSWNAAIQAAGFIPLAQSAGRRHRREAA